MDNEMTFSCSCGEVTGTLIEAGPAMGDHIVCHCTDCQNFARYLGAGERVLGSHGGTDLYQGRCAKMRVTQGIEKLACLHLTDQPTLRWYATCCRTPMFNSFKNGRMPYLTTLLANCDAKQVEAKLGPVIGHLSLPDTAEGAQDAPRMSFGKLMFRSFRRMAKDLVSGDRKRSMLFDPKTLDPIYPPHRLTEAERRSLK